jgi:MoaA/NifB/PqqE/SkfB family radical SAM enzyme
MYVNKYTFWRRMLYRLYDAVPPARVIKRASLPFKIRKLRRIVDARKGQLAKAAASGGPDPLFTHVEIETINRCNGECGFCPVNRHADPRPAARMKEDLFRSIIGQLREMDYRRSLYLYSNNEPLLDTRIVDFAAHAKEQLPAASVRMYTNGILLTPDILRRLAPHLDDITINNYSDDFTLAPNIREILDMSERDSGLSRKVRVVMRYRRELMTSRGGQSPNKLDILPRTLPVGCLLPARQLIVRPDGRLSLCCNDAVGVMTLGDANTDSILDIWNSPGNKALRRRVLEGRGGVDLCRQCDTMHF